MNPVIEAFIEWMPTMILSGIVGFLLGISKHAPHLLVRLGVSRLPEQYRERLFEEWKAVLDETPGRFRKLMFAIDLIRGAVALNRDFAAREQEAKRERETKPQAPAQAVTVTTTGTHKFYGGGYPEPKDGAQKPGGAFTAPRPWKLTATQKVFEWFKNQDPSRERHVFISYSHKDRLHLKNIGQEQLHLDYEGDDEAGK